MVLTKMVKTYSGFKNKATWNVALYLGASEGMVGIVQMCNNYQGLRDIMTQCGYTATSDGVRFDDPTLDTKRLDEVILELRK